MVKDLAVSGRRTARGALRRARLGRAPQHRPLARRPRRSTAATWGLWPTGGAWLCTHLWEHYEFTGDRAFLRDVYPRDERRRASSSSTTLVEEPAMSRLVTSPSISPENRHSARQSSICAGPTMDMPDPARPVRPTASRRRRRWGSTGVRATARGGAGTPGADADRQGRAVAGVARRIGIWSAGAAAPPRVAPLRLYPGSQITPRETPELFAAAAKHAGAARRRRHGLVRWPGRSTSGPGCSTATAPIACCTNLLRPSTARQTPLTAAAASIRNLFDAHPPFQIDGNFGATAGIAEMLLQSHAGDIHLLPALPQAWPTGAVKGLRVRGGIEVDLSWRQGRLEMAMLKSAARVDCKVRYGSLAVNLHLSPGPTGAPGRPTPPRESERGLG